MMELRPVGKTTERFFGNVDVPDGGYVGNADGLPLIIFDYANDALQLGGTNILGAGNIAGTDLDITGTGLFGGVVTVEGIGDGGLTSYDLKVGDTEGTPTYGMIQMGNAVIGRTSYKAGNIDIDGAILVRNISGPVTSEIEFLWTESTGDTCRFALPKSAVGNATYNSRSMLLAGPAPPDTDFVKVSYWQGQGIFDNLACDTAGDGADLGVQHSLEVEGDIFAGGILFMEETTTPTPVANYGALYTKNTNTLWFQDGAGVEHLLHGDAFSNIWFHGTGSVEVAISTQDAFTKIDSFTVVGHEDDLSNVVGSAANDNLTLSSVAGGEYVLSYHGSVTATGGADKEMSFATGITLATPKDITNVTDDTVTPIVITSVAHGFDNGDMVEIAGVLVNTAANGSFIVDNKANDTFEIVNLDGSATTGNGDYDEGTPTGDVTVWYPGNMEVHRMVRGADFGSISATGFHILADDDVLALYVANLSGTTNLTVSAVSLGINRIGD